MDIQEYAEELVGIEEESPEVEKTVYELFKWSVLLKGAISLAEVVVGIALLLLPKAWVTSGIGFITSLLLTYLPYTPIQHVVDELLHYGSDAIVFAALFLLSRGLIKCVLIWALLKSILWAYPSSLVVMGLFVIYQIYEIVLTGSTLIIGITLFDLVVMYFIWREWRIVLRHQVTEEVH
jgi:uncharacterized membrane protein